MTTAFYPIGTPGQAWGAADTGAGRARVGGASGPAEAGQRVCAMEMAGRPTRAQVVRRMRRMGLVRC